MHANGSTIAQCVGRDGLAAGSGPAASPLAVRIGMMRDPRELARTTSRMAPRRIAALRQTDGAESTRLSESPGTIGRSLSA